MKFIGKINDNILNKECLLYVFNARELKSRITKYYKFTDLELQDFNFSSGLFEAKKNAYDHKRLLEQADKQPIDGDKRSIIYAKGTYEYWLESDKKELDKIKKKIADHRLMGEVKTIWTNMGYNTNAFVVCVYGDVANEDTKLELIDGFRRMFCVNEVPDIEVLVKVYEPFDDRLWINSMIEYNSWKFPYTESSNAYMDRGFQFGIYNRYGLKFSDMLKAPYSMFKLIDLYAPSSEQITYRCSRYDYNDVIAGDNTIYETLWNNSEFINDIKGIYELFDMEKYQFKDKKGIVYTVDFHRASFSGVVVLCKYIARLLGRIRRYEYQHNLEHNRFDFAALDGYFSNQTTVKHCVKLLNMNVPGYIENHIRDKMFIDLYNFMYSVAGHKDITIKEREPVKLGPIDIDKLEL